METRENINYVLKKPVTKGDELITTLNLREPTIGEVLNSEKEVGPTSSMLSLIGQVSGIDKSFLKNLSVSDFRAASEIIGNFISDDGLATGAN